MRVTIVGAGIVGYATAYELAARGVQVRLIDQRGPGRGATNASAGILAPYIEGHSAALRRLGVCSLELYDGFVRRVAVDAQDTVEYRRSGTLQVACAADDANELEHLASELRHENVLHSLIDARETRRLEPALSNGVQAGLLIPQHGYVGVATLIGALVEAGARRGVTLSIGHVHTISETGGGLVVQTADESVASDAVVLAAGSWSADITMTPARPPMVRPVRGQLVHLRLPSPPISRVVWGSEAYLVPWIDGSVLVGATVEDVGFDERLTSEGVRQMLDAGNQLVSALKTATFHEARTGLRPATSDELPIIGPSSTMRGVYYATGHYRNGVLLAPLTAMLIADHLVDGRERPEAHLVRPDRFGL